MIVSYSAALSILHPPFSAGWSVHDMYKFSYTHFSSTFSTSFAQLIPHVTIGKYKVQGHAKMSISWTEKDNKPAMQSDADVFFIFLLPLRIHSVPPLLSPRARTFFLWPADALRKVPRHFLLLKSPPPPSPPPFCKKAYITAVFPSSAR